jgi:hypothetical protein
MSNLLNIPEDDKSIRENIEFPNQFRVHTFIFGIGTDFFHFFLLMLLIIILMMAFMLCLCVGPIPTPDGNRIGIG